MFPTIELFGRMIDTYNFCMLLSFIAVSISISMLKPKELPLTYVILAVIIVYAASHVGAKALCIILHPEQHKGESILEMFQTAGFAYLGAPIFALLGFWGLCRILKVSFLVFADYIAPFFMLDRVIGRLGCLAYGCCHGLPSDLPWAYAFRGWRIVEIVPRHPTPAYMIMYTLAILVSSRYLYKKLKNIPGVFAFDHKDAPLSGITFFYVILSYSIMRFFNEFLRAEGPFIYGPIKASHAALFIFAIIAAAGLFIIIRRSGKKGEILKALKGAVIRLVLWFLASGAAILSLIAKLN